MEKEWTSSTNVCMGRRKGHSRDYADAVRGESVCRVCGVGHPGSPLRRGSGVCPRKPHVTLDMWQAWPLEAEVLVTGRCLHPRSV